MRSLVGISGLQAGEDVNSTPEKAGSNTILPRGCEILSPASRRPDKRKNKRHPTQKEVVNFHA